MPKMRKNVFNTLRLLLWIISVTIFPLQLWNLGRRERNCVSDLGDLSELDYCTNAPEYRGPTHVQPICDKLALHWDHIHFSWVLEATPKEQTTTTWIKSGLNHYYRDRDQKSFPALLGWNWDALLAWFCDIMQDNMTFMHYGMVKFGNIG